MHSWFEVAQRMCARGADDRILPIIPLSSSTGAGNRIWESEAGLLADAPEEPRNRRIRGRRVGRQAQIIPTDCSTEDQVDGSILV
jgi:hypothetical protein